MQINFLKNFGVGKEAILAEIEKKTLRSKASQAQVNNISQGFSNKNNEKISDPAACLPDRVALAGCVQQAEPHHTGNRHLRSGFRHAKPRRHRA